MCCCTSARAALPSASLRAMGASAAPDAPAPSSPGETSGRNGGTRRQTTAQAADGAEQLIRPIGDRKITSPFGAKESFRSSPHTGTDYSAPTGTEIRAAAGGTVVFAGWAQGGGGNVVTIDHGNGYYTSYAHQSQVLVRKGDVLAQGDVLGKVGSTGFSTGPHLQFELLKGGTNPTRDAVDAEAFIRRGGTI